MLLARAHHPLVRFIMFNKMEKEMKLSKWKKDICYMTDKEIVEYYGQIWGNVKHLKSYVGELRQRYINEIYC